MRKTLLVLGLSLASWCRADFLIKKIEVEGAQKIPVGTVLNYLPLETGDLFKDENSGLIISALYRSGFFKDIKLLRKGNNTLLIKVIEQSTLSVIRIVGNKEFSTKTLREILSSLDIKEGRAVNNAELKRIKAALLEQYRLKGYYAAEINFSLNEEIRDRQELIIRISEGEIAKVKQIHFIGNKIFTEKELRTVIETKTTNWLSWIHGNNRYSATRLEADCARIREYYMDHGYLNARVVNRGAYIKVPTSDNKSSWISLINDDVSRVKGVYDPRKSGVAINFFLSEGQLFYFDSFRLEGELIGKKRELLNAITIKPGKAFSRKTVVESRAAMMNVLGDLGYGAPDLLIKYQEIGNRVRVIFEVHPRHRIYLRHIEFKGNNRTQDSVLRREMRLQEGGLYSVNKINESTRRLANLGYVEQLNFQLIPVEGKNNQVDLIYNFKEVSDITLNLQAGVSDQGGCSFVAGLSVTDNNLLGTGKSVGIRADYARASQSLGFNFYNPYFWQDRVGYGFSVNASQHDPNKIDGNLSSYRTRSISIMNSFDIPLNDYIQMGMGLGYEYLSEVLKDRPNRRAREFLEKYGEKFNLLKLVWELRYSKLDRGIFPKKGLYTALILEDYTSLARQSLYFYKINWRLGYYYPIYRNWIVKIGAEAGYGNSFSGTDSFPFFKNFYAGGINSLRGFDPGTISGIEDKGRVIGGNLLTLSNIALIFPTPWPEMLRVSLFCDAGGVYRNAFNLNDVRVSVGLQFELRTPVGPLALSFSKAIRSHSWDETKCIQFNISGGF